MEGLKIKWESLSLTWKVILVITSPVLMLIYFSIVALSRRLDVIADKKVQAQSEVDDKKEQATDTIIDVTQGKIDELNAEKIEAEKEAKNGKPTPSDFFNDRKYNDNE